MSEQIDLEEALAAQSRKEGLLYITQPGVTIELPGEPRGKGRPRAGRSAAGFTRMYTDKDTAEYERNLRLQGGVAMAGRVPFQGALYVHVEATFPVPGSWSGIKKRRALEGLLHHTTKPDADNIVKMLDALNTVVWLDDKQISQLVLIKRYSARPCLRIEVRTAV